MEILGWLWWLIASVLGFVWSLLWFLIGGWVSTLAQILVVAGLVFVYKFGWRRAPMELLTRSKGLFRWVWAWIRKREVPPPTVTRTQTREVVRVVRRRRPGDVNLSSLMNVAMLAGLALLASI